MNLMLIEIPVVAFGLLLLLLDLWVPAESKKNLGYAAAAFLAVVLALSFLWHSPLPQYAFNQTFVLDPFALYFKRFFLLAAIFVLIISVDFADRILVGVSEFYALTLFALAGMLFAASTNDFVMLFVSLELITVTFYILNSYQRSKLKALEAGVKYLILGALSTGFTLFGIALVYGTSGTTNFSILSQNETIYQSRLFVLGLFFVVIGLGFKISAFPFQIWAPDVYEGSPVPATAFLAVGSKAAGFVLLMRLLFNAVPAVTIRWHALLMVIAIITILYGNLCAIPQRNLKRLLGYSSIGNAGYLLLGITAVSYSGSSAVLYYLLGYLFTVLAAFLVISAITRNGQDEDISVLAGLHQRSPILAATLAFSMVSLAGIPPLAGFFGKFLLLKSVIERAAAEPVYWVLIGVALFGIVTSFYYYLGVVRAIYWSREVPDLSPIKVAPVLRLALYACLAGMLYLGLFPNTPLNATRIAAAALTMPAAGTELADAVK
jgi:NADH-quinone oxidoreductase subunit N